jgi:hypothetical protein
MNILPSLKIASVIGALGLIVGSFMPLWSQNAVVVTGWEGDYLGWGRWLLVAAAFATIAMAIWLGQKHFSKIGLAGWLAAWESFLIFFEGYKWNAIGYGAWVLIFSSIVIIAASAVSSLLFGNGSDDQSSEQHGGSWFSRGN